MKSCCHGELSGPDSPAFPQLSEYAEQTESTFQPLSDPSNTRRMVMPYLFPVIALFAVVGVALFANRQQRFSTDDIRINAKQIRQELRAVAYLLAGIVILLGIIADRIH